MPVLNASIRAFTYSQLPRLHNLYWVAHTCTYIVFLPERWKCCTKLTEIFHLTSWYMLGLRPLDPRITGEYGRIKGKWNHGCPMAPVLSLLLFSPWCWLIQGSKRNKKGMVGVQSVVFFRMSLALHVFKASSGPFLGFPFTFCNMFNFFLPHMFKYEI